MERDPLAVPGLDVAVDAVVGRVELAADEPLREREVPLEDRVPLLRPVERERLTRPVALPVAFRVVVDRGVGHERVLAERLRRRERPAFLQQRLERLRHAPPLSRESGLEAIGSGAAAPPVRCECYFGATRIAVPSVSRGLLKLAVTAFVPFAFSRRIVAGPPRSRLPVATSRYS